MAWLMDAAKKAEAALNQVDQVGGRAVAVAKESLADPASSDGAPLKPLQALPLLPRLADSGQPQMRGDHR